MSKLETLKAGLKTAADAFGNIPLVHKLSTSLGNVLKAPINLVRGITQETRKVANQILLERTKEAATDIAKSRWELMWDVPKSLVTGPLNAAWMALSPLGRLLQGALRTTGHVAKIPLLLATLHLTQAKDQLISTGRVAIQNILKNPMPKLENAPEFAKQVAKPVTTFLDAEWKFAAGIGNALKNAGQGLTGIMNIPEAGIKSVRSGWQNGEQAANDGNYGKSQQDAA